MAYSPIRSRRPPITRDEKDLHRAVLAVTLGQASPNHAWLPEETTTTVTRPGCARCPWGSPFHRNPASHPYIIKEEP